jgi:hypothetical protein
MQRSATYDAFRVHICAAIEQQRHDRTVAAFCRIKQRRRAILCVRADESARLC